MQATHTSIEELSSEGTEGSLEIETTQMRQSTTQEETLQTSMEVGETTSETKVKVKTTHQKYILDHFYPHPVFRKHPQSKRNQFLLLKKSKLPLLG